jgi:hypothetical protein
MITSPPVGTTTALLIVSLFSAGCGATNEETAMENAPLNPATQVKPAFRGTYHTGLNYYIAQPNFGERVRYYGIWGGSYVNAFRFVYQSGGNLRDTGRLGAVLGGTYQEVGLSDDPTVEIWGQRGRSHLYVDQVCVDYGGPAGIYLSGTCAGGNGGDPWTENMGCYVVGGVEVYSGSWVNYFHFLEYYTYNAGLGAC